MSVGKFLQSPLGLALIAFLVTFVALVAINPPLTQTQTNNAWEIAKPNLTSVAIYAGIVAVLAFLAPYAARQFASSEPDVIRRPSRPIRPL